MEGGDGVIEADGETVSRASQLIDSFQPPEESVEGMKEALETLSTSV